MFQSYTQDAVLRMKVIIDKKYHIGKRNRLCDIK